MPSPRKNSDDTEHAIEEAKPREVEREDLEGDNTSQEGKQAIPQIIPETVDPQVAEAQPVKTVKEIAVADEVFHSGTKKSVSPQSEVPPAVDTNVDSSKGEAVRELSDTIVPSIKITFISPQNIEDESEQSTGASSVQVKGEQEIEIEQHFEKSERTEGEVSKKTVDPEVEKVDHSKSSVETVAEIIKSSLERQTQESESCKLELSTEPDKNIEQINTETVLPEDTIPIVQVKKIADGSSQEPENKSKESSQFSDVPGKIEQETKETSVMVQKEVSGSENPQMEKNHQMLEEAGELKSSTEVPHSSTTIIPDSEQLLSSKGNFSEDTPFPDHKPASTKASDDSTQPNVHFRGPPSNVEKSMYPKKLSEDFISKLSRFEPSRRKDRSKIWIKISEPDFAHAPVVLKPVVVVEQGKFQVSLDISKFDVKNIDLSIENGNIQVEARQESGNEQGYEYYFIHQMIKIPNHVTITEFSAYVSETSLLFIEAPIEIPSS